MTKTEKVGVAPDAKGDTVTVGAGAARHWPVDGLVWHRVTWTGRDALVPVEVFTVMEAKLLPL